MLDSKTVVGRMVSARRSGSAGQKAYATRLLNQYARQQYLNGDAVSERAVVAACKASATKNVLYSR